MCKISKHQLLNRIDSLKASIEVQDLNCGEPSDIFNYEHYKTKSGSYYAGTLRKTLESSLRINRLMLLDFYNEVR